MKNMDRIICLLGLGKKKKQNFGHFWGQIGTTSMEFSQVPKYVCWWLGTVWLPLNKLKSEL